MSWFWGKDTSFFSSEKKFKDSELSLRPQHTSKGREVAVDIFGEYSRDVMRNVVDVTDSFEDYDND